MREEFQKSALVSLQSEQNEWPEPDMSLLETAPQRPPRFPFELFGNAAAYLKDAAQGAEAPIDFSAAMLLAGVSALTGKSYQVRVNADWTEPLIIWAAMVGPPGCGKTPACKPIRSILFQIEEVMKAEFSAKLKTAIQSSDNEDEIEAFQAMLPFPPRLVVNDSTVEALARVELRAELGLLIFRDELSGLIEGLERYSKGVDRAYYLEAFTQGGFKIDRVKAGPLTIENHTFSLIGGIQPDRLKALLLNAGNDDGFSSRVLIFNPNQLPAGPIPKGADHAPLETAFYRFFNLSKLETSDFETLVLSSEARAVFEDWYQIDRARRHGTLGMIGSAYSKLPGYALRIAGLLHVLDWAFAENETALDEAIQERHMAAALQLIESYFVPQIVRTYTHVAATPVESFAAAILNHCKTHEIDRFRLRDVYRSWRLPGARSKGASSQIREAAQLLIKTNWVKAGPGAFGANDFLVNPALINGAVA